MLCCHKAFPIIYASQLTLCRIHTTKALLKGHSKWQNIRHIKAANDAQKATKIRQQMFRIRCAVAGMHQCFQSSCLLYKFSYILNSFPNNFPEGGGSANPETNSILRSTIDIALKYNVPRATIQSALKKMKECPDEANMRRHVFECRLYQKVFVVFTYYTINLGTTRVPLGTAFRKHNAELIKIRHMFEEKGYVDALVPPRVNESNIEDDCTTDAIECGASDVHVHNAAERQVTFYCEPNAVVGVRQNLEKLGYQIENSDISFDAHKLVRISKKEKLDYDKFMERLRAIEGFDDVFDNIESDGEDNS